MKQKIFGMIFIAVATLMFVACSGSGTDDCKEDPTSTTCTDECTVDPASPNCQAVPDDPSDPME